jgi:hypothetical protein
VTQPAADGDSGEPLGQLADRVLQAQAQGGPYAKELIEPLAQLSLLYQERGDHALESAALEQALQVVRANYGLRSLAQAPLIRQRIRSEESVGNFTEAWQLEQALVALAQKHPDDPRTVPIFREIGDKRMQLLSRYLSGERPPQLYLGCYYDPSVLDARNCSSGQRSVAAYRIVLDAQQNYASAIAVLRRQQQHEASEELRELEDTLLRNSHFYGAYQQGRRSLVRRVYDDAASSKPLLRRVDGLVQLADWDLRYAERKLALDLYAEIYAYLESQGVEQPRIDEIFAPATPIVLPTFVPNLFAAERADGAAGFVDVAFEITQFGTTRRIKVLDRHNASKAAEQRLARWIVDNRFRPMMTDGRFVDASRVVARHYVHE